MGKGDNDFRASFTNEAQEARVKDDLWSGKTDAAERRKRQNRLHQRAWRRRKALQCKKESSSFSETQSQPYDTSVLEDFDLDDVPAPPKTAPPVLQATALQRAVPHELWIDTIPYPVLRDNIIRNQDELDVDALCDDFVGGMYDGLSEIGSRGLILWGEPWSDEGWEISEGFARKWSFLLKGCDDLIRSTNIWRKNRAEERLIVEV